MGIRELVRFDALQQTFPPGMRPSLQEHLHFSATLFRRRRVKHTIRFVVTAPPVRRLSRSIVFHAFATNRTAFGVIEDLEAVFAEWFLETQTLPIINPIPMRYYEEPQILPKQWYWQIAERGVGIHTYAP